MRQKAMMACLFHFNPDISMVVQFLGGNHTGAHRDVQTVAHVLLTYGVPKALVQQYVCVMTVGYPITMNTDVSRENVLQYWQAGKNPSVKANIPLVKETTNNRNTFVIPHLKLVVVIHPVPLHYTTAHPDQERKETHDP
jgi:hypothetical protein